MARTQFTIDFSELDELFKKYESLTDHEELRKLVEKELINIYKEFQPLWEQRWKKHNDTGQTEQTLLPVGAPYISWSGDVVSVKMGFDLSKDNYRGVISQYITFGTKVNGTPRIKPDQELLSLVKGSNKSKMKQRLMDKVADAIVEKLTGVK